VKIERGAYLVKGVSELYTPFERLESAAFVVEDGRFAWVGREDELPEQYSDVPPVQLGGRGVLPGFVDSHTHLVWDGSRVAEYVARSRGADYEELLEAGGGIHATVAATREASEERLLSLARRRARSFVRGGVTTLEVKSGYGLTTADELKQLRVARRLGEERSQRVTTTLLAHLPDPQMDRAQYVERFATETIPEAARSGLADAFDVFVDRGGFEVDEARRLYEAAMAEGLPIKGHVEQLTRTGGARLLAELGALSADHLERATESDLVALAEAGVVATVLPGAAALLAAGLPSARTFHSSGVKVAIASDHNPGSSPLYSLLPALQLATAVYGFSVLEVLIGATAHAADALGRPELGRVQAGAVADYLVVDGFEALLPLYAWGSPHLTEAVLGGTTVWRREV